MGYGFGRSPFFVAGNTMSNQWGQHQINTATPEIDTHILNKKIMPIGQGLF